MKIVSFIILFTSIFLCGKELLFKEAVELAKEKEKPILLIFSGSDWCSSCIKLNKELLSNNLVAPDVHNKYVIHVADFPRKNNLTKKKKLDNEKLAEKYNREGSFPKLILIDSNSQESKVIKYRPGNETQLLTDLGIQQ